MRSLLRPGEAAGLYTISMDEPAVSRDFAEKIAADGKGAITFRMLSDPGHRVIDAYGLRDASYTGQKFEGTPLPAVYMIDKEGRVAWAVVEEDYRQRPTNEELRAALDALM